MRGCRWPRRHGGPNLARMEGELDARGYATAPGGLGAHHRYLLPPIERLLATEGAPRLFEIGFGSGAVADHLTRRGYQVSGIDPADASLAAARRQFPHLDGLARGDVYQDLAGRFGRFPVVLSIEVVEHLYLPRRFAAAAFDLLDPGGLLIATTPYHGYWKNLAVALAGRCDAHWNPLWDHGHIKFWSPRTLSALLAEAGFRVEGILRVGRPAPFAKSMIALARRVEAAGQG